MVEKERRGEDQRWRSQSSQREERWFNAPTTLHRRKVVRYSGTAAVGRLGPYTRALTYTFSIASDRAQARSGERTYTGKAGWSISALRKILIKGISPASSGRLPWKPDSTTRVRVQNAPACVQTCAHDITRPCA